MLIYYATLKDFMRTSMGVIMRTTSSVKKSVNVSLAPDIVAQARALNINLSAVLTDALQDIFREHQRVAWQQENRQQIDAVNQFAEQNGALSDFQRSF